MGNDFFFGKDRRLNIFIYIILIIMFQLNFLYPQVKDSSKVSFKLHSTFPDYQPKNDSIKISLKYKPKLNEIQLYDPKTVIPTDPMKIDYRHHPYYTPRIVDDFINMNIMDRPPASSFVSLPTIALLAAAVAIKYISIKDKLKLTVSDYLLEDKYYPVLSALWKKSPQKAEELFLDSNIRNGRSMTMLISDLEVLVDKRLLKTKKMPKSSTEYFVVQKKEQVLELVEKSALLDSTQQIRLHKLNSILATH